MTEGEEKRSDGVGRAWRLTVEAGDEIGSTLGERGDGEDEKARLSN